MTTRKNVNRYRGSGVYWRQHIKKYGYDVDTQVVAKFDILHEATDFALKFSKENDIVGSVEWANLMEENCHYGLPAGFVHSENTRKKMSDTAKGHIRSKKHCENISKSKKGISNPEASKRFKGIPLSEDHRRKLAEAKRGRTLSQEHRNNMMKSHSKSWLVIKPSGEQEIVVNLKRFCLENGLNSGVMCMVGKGIYTQHKGFSCRKV
jgi:hypothetical protein